MKNDRPTVIDLFCGCGGLSLGAARAGFSVVAGLDTDERAIKAHALNFPESKHLELDIATLSGSDITRELTPTTKDIDGLIGGPPCQGFSYIGKGKRNDKRNRLFFHFFRLVNELRPSFFLCENVPGILSPKHDRKRRTALRQIEDDYTILPPMKLKASDYGAPTTRTRVLYIGTRKDLGIEIQESDFEPKKDLIKVPVKDALKGLRKSISPDWQSAEQGWRIAGRGVNGGFGRRINAFIPKGIGDPEAIRILKEEKRVSGCLGTVHAENVLERFDTVPQGAMDDVSRTTRLNLNGFCPTLRAGTGSDHGSHQALRPIHPTENRMITVREAARLQGFPDWFQFDDTKWHSFRQIGNSVSPILAEVILRVISNAVANFAHEGEIL